MNVGTNGLQISRLRALRLAWKNAVNSNSLATRWLFRRSNTTAAIWLAISLSLSLSLSCSLAVCVCGGYDED
jgi:hypothetical protein